MFLSFFFLSSASSSKVSCRRFLLCAPDNLLPATIDPLAMRMSFARCSAMTSLTMVRSS